MQVLGRPRAPRRSTRPVEWDHGLTARALPLVAWLGGLLGLLAGALALGSTPAFAGPPVARPGELAGWATARPPVEAAFAVLRVVVVVLAAYLLLMTVLAVAVRLVRAGRLITVVDVVTLPSVRRLVRLALGAGLLTAPLGPAGPALSHAATTSTQDVHLATAAGDRAPADDGVIGTPDAPPGPPMMRRLHPPEPVGAAPSEVVIAAGDHLWSVAERALATAWGRTPSDAEVAPFWEQVVEVNRARLADPSNPDLLFTGQLVAVPVPPTGPPG